MYLLCIKTDRTSDKLKLFKGQERKKNKKGTSNIQRSIWHQDELLLSTGRALYIITFYLRLEDMLKNTALSMVCIVSTLNVMHFLTGISTCILPQNKCSTQVMFQPVYFPKQTTQTVVMFRQQVTMVKWDTAPLHTRLFIKDPLDFF